MSQNLQTLSGTVEHIIFCNEETGYTVLELSCDGELYTAVGELAEICEGEEVTLHGYFTAHPNFGEQFRAEAYEVRLPETAAAMKRYLASGVLPYIR